MAIIKYCKVNNKGVNPESINEEFKFSLEDGSNFTFSGDNFEHCIVECAVDYFGCNEKWEEQLPCIFMLWIDDQYIGTFDVVYQCTSQKESK